MVSNGMASVNSMYSSLYAYFQLGKGVYDTVGGSQGINSLCHTEGKGCDTVGGMRLGMACVTQWVV